MGGWNGMDAVGHGGHDAGPVGPAAGGWPARWLRPGRIAWATFLLIWGGLVLVGAPIDLAMLPAAVCAGVNLALLRMDERLLRPRVPDTVPAAWSGIGPVGEDGPRGHLHDPDERHDEDR